MATTDEIMKQAAALGRLIAEHKAAKQFKTLMAKLEADVEAQRILNDFGRKLAEIEEKEQTGRPIEVDDKRAVEALRRQVVKHPLLREFQMAQFEYVDLMRKVDEALNGAGANISPSRI